MKYYRIKATIEHKDGRVVNYRYGMNLKEFKTFNEKVLKPQGDKVIKVESIKEPMRYYS